MNGRPVAREVAAQARVGEADFPADVGPTQVEPAPGLKPLRIDSGEERSIQEEAIDHGRPQDRSGVEAAIL